MSAAAKLLPVPAAVAACIACPARRISRKADQGDHPLYTRGAGRSDGPWHWTEDDPGLGTACDQGVQAGAGLVIGADFVAKAPADGYTLLMGASSMFVESGAGSRTPADNLRELAPVSLAP